jgi:hypothetical protein
MTLTRPRHLCLLALATLAPLACGSNVANETTSAADGGGGSGGARSGASAGSGGSALSSCGSPTETYTATGTDQSAILVDGTTQTVANATITSDSVTSSQDDSSFHGLNAAVLAKNGGTLTLSCATVTTTGAGANGVFATGAGSAISLSNVAIQCSADGGHGVDATETATLHLQDVDIATAGSHGAAIATDRGGGTIDAVGGTVTTSGIDSPGIYSTGIITVSGAVISATGAEGAVIEGANSITLTDTDLSGAKGTRDRGLMVYQSMSGDAQGNQGVFTMTGGSFTWPSTTGPAIYVTNTTAVITLSNVALSNSSGTLLKASADQWGTSGANGGTVTFTADGQSLSGDLVADSLSSITVTLQNASSLSGSINSDGGAKSVALTLDETSTWGVGADSVVATLTDASVSFGNIVSNGHNVCYKLTVNGTSSGTYSLSGGGELSPCD